MPTPLPLSLGEGIKSTARGGVAQPKQRGLPKKDVVFFGEKERPAFKAKVLRLRETSHTAQRRDEVPYGNLNVPAKCFTKQDD